MKVRAKTKLMAIVCFLVLLRGGQAIAQEVEEVRTIDAEALERLRERNPSVIEPSIKPNDLICTGTTVRSAVESAIARNLHLTAASLANADLHEADLNGADFRGAELTRANLSGADLHESNLTGANLSGAYLSAANLKRAMLGTADLRGAFLERADLRGAIVLWTDLSGADLTGVDLSAASLMGADLNGANLTYTDITTTVLREVRLEECLFESSSPYSLQNGLPSLGGLDTIRYAERKEMLVGMRNAFKEGGYREWERAVTAGINRSDNAHRAWPLRFGHWLAFDLTCAYGFRNLRPLWILLGVWATWSAIYYLIFRLASDTTGVELVIPYESEEGKALEHKYRVRPHMEIPEGWPRAPSLILLALYFSLLSTFNLKFRWVEVGGWIRLLRTRIFDLRPLGWARTLSGLQALLCVYLLALWVLTTFGRPFEG